MNEHNIGKTIHLALSKIGARLFRNNVAFAWRGDKITKLDNGDIIIHNPRPIHAGLCKGSSDYIGWKPVKITPDMVGRTVAVFTACEVKTPSGRASGKQKTFLSAVRAAGGISFIARSSDEAINKCKI